MQRSSDEPHFSAMLTTISSDFIDKSLFKPVYTSVFRKCIHFRQIADLCYTKLSYIQFNYNSNI